MIDPPLQAHQEVPKQIFLDWNATGDPYDEPVFFPSPAIRQLRRLGSGEGQVS
jgi:hypothetical protein